MNNSTSKLLLGFLTGIAVMLIVNYFHQPSEVLINNNVSTAGKTPLYWVAPMDANYRRDKPGKSPMGMDLVPFYGSDPNEEVGSIRISPDVVNNLGVKTGKAKMKPMYTEINTVGYVQYNEDEIIHVHSRVEGWIEKLNVKALGDRVEKGQILYEIYSPALVNAQQELVLALTRKNTSLITAAKDRLAALQIPESVIKHLIKSKTIQQNIAFYAPQSGFVDNLNIRQGYFVKPDKTMMSISKLDSVWVEAAVFERQASLVTLDTQVSLTVKFLPSKTWKGVVDYIYPQLDEKTRTLKVRMRFDNQNYQLKPNMFANITLHTRNDENILLIPKSAVIRTGKSNRVVLALGEGTYKSVNVKIGRIGADQIEILSGISEEDKVVTSAQFLLDSESSKTSDFLRMNHNKLEDIQNIPTATSKGMINSIIPDNRMIVIDREAIIAWDREAAIVDYRADELVDISNLSVDDEVIFTFQIQNGEFVITEINKLNNN